MGNATQQNGATLIPEVALRLRATADAVEVSAETGQTIRGHKALIATGGFSFSAQFALAS